MQHIFVYIFHPGIFKFWSLISFEIIYNLIFDITEAEHFTRDVNIL